MDTDWTTSSSLRHWSLQKIYQSRVPWWYYESSCPCAPLYLLCIHCKSGSSVTGNSTIMEPASFWLWDTWDQLLYLSALWWRAAGTTKVLFLQNTFVFSTICMKYCSIFASMRRTGLSCCTWEIFKTVEGSITSSLQLFANPISWGFVCCTLQVLVLSELYSNTNIW